MLYTYIALILLTLIPTLAKAAPSYQEVEDYLNSIRTFKAEFKQYGADSIVRTGVFYLSKPGKVKWEYIEPKRMMIMGNGNQIVYCDYELEEVSYVSSKSVLAHFLSKESINLSKDISVEKYIKGKHYAELTVYDKASEKETNISKLILKFEYDPFRLIEISIIDLNEQETEIIFNNIKTNIDLEKSIFVFKNPRFFTGIKR
jgi:outer membrane lipoprotein-sorting protein